MDFLTKYWNGRTLGLFHVARTFLKISFISIHEKLTSKFNLLNLAEYGKNCFIQKSVSIRYPGNIYLKDHVHIGRNVELNSEFRDSSLIIKSNVQVNRNTRIDFSGNVVINENVVISEGSKIFSHSHGYDPHSRPIKKPLEIGENVWVGSNVIILENVNVIGKNSLIAAGSVVTKDVPPNCVVGGNPARILKENINMHQI